MGKNNESAAEGAHYEFSEQVGHLLRKAYQRHLAIFQQHAGDRQLTAVQFVTLCALDDNGACSLTDLVRLTAIDPATIRGVTERLRGRELIRLADDRSDRRKVIVELTDAGRETVAQMVPRALEISELTLGNLNPAERFALLFLLRRMNEQEQPEAREA